MGLFQGMAGWIWLAVVVVFVLLEAVTAQLVSVWFVAGSLAALIGTLLGAPLWLQLTLFVVVSAIALAIIRPLVRKRLEPKKVPTNADMVIGKTAVVISQVDNDLYSGRVEVSGLSWAARSADGTRLSEGLKVRIDAIEGVTLIVSKITEEN